VKVDIEEPRKGRLAGFAIDGFVVSGEFCTWGLHDGEITSGFHPYSYTWVIIAVVNTCADQHFAGITES
jgi:hypothetical protein